MQIQYTTQSGSVYIRTVHEGLELWCKLDKHGEGVPLAGGMHLSRRQLQQLITDYPASAMDRTACFGSGIAKEFFDDAKRLGSNEVPAGEESTIFFLVCRGLGQYGIGHSSRVVKVERSDFEGVEAASMAS